MLTYKSTFSGFSVDDIIKAKEFYGSMLGIDTKETEEGLELHVSGDAPVFLYPKPNHAPASYTVLNFLVTDIDAAADELIAAGVSLETYDMGKMGTADEKGIYRGKEGEMGPTAIAWLLDPAGNILSIIQE
ncbi:MAG: Lactoylglutathione lyase-related protein [Parcubacteria bacterium C7867-004]|nr:MAG: Lactoylglutathione lyase-related protein [Parcubacteria bacterium C7867-004]